MSEAAEQHQIKKSKKGPWIVLGVFALLGLLAFFYWFFLARFTLSTNDAYVEGNRIEIFPQIAGTVTAIHVQETDYVQAGDVLIELDPTDATLAFESSLSKLGNAVRQVVQKFDQVYQYRALVEVRQSEVIKAKNHYENRAPLVSIGAVTKEDFQNAVSDLTSAKASLGQALEDLKGAEAQIYNTSVKTHPIVLEAIDQVRSCWVNLKRTVIRAPQEGYVALKNAQVGESALISRPLLSLVPLNEIWVNANFREVKLSKVELGQKVELKSDVYKNKVKFSGLVVGISPSTGSFLSVLPPQNAAGNWIKIVQRVPVRIQLDPQQLKEHPLRVGLSMNAKMDLRDEVHPLPQVTASVRPLYQTSVYQDQIQGVEPIIDQVIMENIKGD